MVFEPIDREDMLRVVRRYGPVQPLDARRHLGKGESTLIGAVLSELVHNGKVAVTNMKRGSSPFYYDPNNPASLEKVGHFLGEKDARTFELLKRERLVRADAVDPLTRVSLGNIKDFSRPIHVQHEGEQLLFYRYFLLSQQEAEARIRELLSPAPKSTPKKELKKETEREKPAKKKTTKPTSPAAKPAQSKRRPPKKQAQAARQRTLSESTSNAIDADDPFLKRVVRYCDNKGLVIQSHAVVRKKQEVDLVVLMQTAVGKARYFIKAKSKKRSNDGDLAGALLAAQRQQLPVIYLTTGQVTKKAKEMPELSAVIVKEIKP